MRGKDPRLFIHIYECFSDSAGPAALQADTYHLWISQILIVTYCKNCKIEMPRAVPEASLLVAQLSSHQPLSILFCWQFLAQHPVRPSVWPRPVRILKASSHGRMPFSTQFPPFAIWNRSYIGTSRATRRGSGLS